MLGTIIKLFIDFGTYFFYLRTFKRENRYLADCILYQIKQGGNVFWKLSQWICSRLEFQYDLQDNYLIQELKKFYENCPAHNFSISREIIERFYGDTLENVFETICETPIASGSIGQVYEAVLKNGEKVAIKIRHPHIRENILQLCRYIGYIPKSILQFDLKGLDKYLLHQTDFKKEYTNLKKLCHKFKNASYIHFPTPIAADEDIIIMEYIDGENIDEFYENSCKSHKNEHWEVMVQFWLFIRESILLRNFCHADLHKGNWKIKDGKIIIYDLGIIIDNRKYFEDYKKIWEGFESRQPYILAPLLVKNILNKKITDCKIEAKFIEFMEERMDMDSLYFSGDIRLIIQFVNQEGYILKFHVISFLISFYLAMSNFKNFSFTKNHKSYIEGHLDILNTLKDKCDKYKNDALKKRILEDEAIFLENNKDRLKKIWAKKDEGIIGITDIDLEESTEESTEDLEEDNYKSDFVAI
jgi:predicted unusual protein kinase regulating ubiquinone biosynthesis (AarF/ABC1/UbiB family)